ncbi:hypothetical protein Pst134EB_020580 [Puccinia striiformis f. sp. tritici]|nr:hypothetical protein Pst134EB_020580 [Puccinia striiformis f. sp. tritici]
MSAANVVRLNPFQKVRRYLQYQAHENPAIFYSVALGVAGQSTNFQIGGYLHNLTHDCIPLGPVLLATVPPIRRNYFGYVSPEQIPMSYPLPQRKRNPDLKGYDD